MKDAIHGWIGYIPWKINYPIPPLNLYNLLAFCGLTTSWNELCRVVYKTREKSWVTVHDISNRCILSFKKHVQNECDAFSKNVQLHVYIVTISLCKENVFLSFDINPMNIGHSSWSILILSRKNIDESRGAKVKKITFRRNYFMSW